MKRPSLLPLFLKILFSLIIVFASFKSDAQVPTITSFTPVSAPIGTAVTISGTNFSTTPADNIVWFGAVKATVNSATATSLTVTVPAGASYKQISVTIAGLTAYSSKQFIATLPGLRIVDATAFASKVDFTTGTSPQGVDIGDIDGDGKPDIVVTNWGSGFVSVFRNNSTPGSVSSGSFETKVDFAVGGNSPFVALGDIDGDGKPDMIVACRTSNVVSVFRNTSTPGSISAASFASKVDFATGNGPDGIAIGDIDGDGKPDLAVTNYTSNTISIFRNTSTTGTITSASFAPKEDLITGLQPYYIALGDLDNDSKPDIVVSNHNSQSISIYRNNASSGSITSASFDPRVDIITGLRPYGVAIGDIDGDNKQDISVVSTDNALVSVFRNISFPGSISVNSFAPKVDFPTGVAPYIIVLSDINGDGKPDLVVGNNGSGTVSILKNNSLPGSIGPGSLSARFDFPGGPSYGIAVGDIDSDGKQDIVVTNYITPTVSILHNEITERVLPVIASFTPTFGPVGTTVTITGSNFSTTPANNIVWFGAVKATVTASTSTQLTVTVPAGATYQPFTVTVTGLTAYSSSPFNVTIPGTNTFEATSLAMKVDLITGTNPSSVVLADIDGDGKSDLIVTISNLSDNTVSVFRNIGSSGTLSAASFLSKIDLYTGSYPLGVAVSDIDGDGKQDIVVANTSNNSVSIFKNMCSPGSITTGSFYARVDLVTSNSPYGVTIGDLDGDGKPDLAVPNYMNNTVSVFRNNSEPGTISTGSFETRVDFPVSSNPYRVAIGDIDGDGKSDLAVTNWGSNTVSILKNLSSAGSFTLSSFATKVDFPTGTNPGQIAIADIDGDGKEDVILANQSSNSFSIFRNISTPGSLTTTSLAPRADFLMDISTGARALAVGDVDGDGKPDLVIGNSFPGNNKYYVFRNTSTSGTIATGSFAPRIEFIAGNEPSNIAIGDIDGDGKADLVVTSANSISLIRNKLSEPLPPTITSFSPASGAVGTSVIISGTNFNITPSNNIVWFGAVKANVTAASSTILTVTVPVGATFKPISVTDITSGYTAYSGKPFNTTFTSTGILNGSAFTPKIDFVTGGAPSGVAVGDIDNDGKPDMVVSNETDNTFSVFKNISSSGSITTGSFAGKFDFSTDALPSGIALSDLDGDGKLDLVVANKGSSISVFRNTSATGSIGAGTFEPRVDLAAGSGPREVAIGDIDGDGKPDIIATNINSNSVSVFINQCTSGAFTTTSFANRLDFTTGLNPVGLALGDIDGDGKIDLTVANNVGGSVSIFRNISTPGSFDLNSFAPRTDLLIGTPWGLDVGDIDGDGKPDIVVTNNIGGLISLFKNNSGPGIISTSTFSSRVDFPTLYIPDHITIGEMDGDGKPDIAITNFGIGIVSVFKNRSTSGSIANSSLSARIDLPVGTNPSGIAICDFDGDNKPDIVATNNSGNSISVLRNIIPETLPPPPTISSFNPTSGIVGSAVTITGTGFSTTSSENIVWFGAVKAIVTASTTTQLTVTVPSGATYHPVNVTVNGLTAYSVIPFNVTFPSIQNIDLRTFPGKVDFNTGIGPKGIAISDIDGDGKSDMIVSNQTGNSISVFRNTSTTGTVAEGSFSNSINFITLPGADGVMASDIDGDGKQDLIISNSMGNSVSVFRNRSTPGSVTLNSFDTRFDFTTNSGPIPFAFAINDIDGDGKPDLVVTNDVNSISVYRNICTLGSFSTGVFAPKVDFSTIAGPRGIAIRDIDGDGKPDLATTNSSSGSVSVFRNTSISGTIGPASLSTNVEFTAGTGPISIAMEDIDGDGKSDLVVTNSMSNTISILRNTSTSGSINSGSFAPKVDFNTNTYPQYCAIGDINGDGKPDIIIVNNLNNSVTVFRNSSSPGSITESSLAPKVDFPLGSPPRGVAIGDIDGDTRPDLLVTNSASNSISVFRNSIPVSIIPPPVISSFTPTSGPIGTPVTITGTNFSTTPSNNIVWFGVVMATVTAATTTQLTVQVPAGTTYQPISVTINGLTGYSGRSFNVTFSGSGIIDATSLAPKIDLSTGFEPQGAAIGDIDSDGKPDIIIVAGMENKFSVYRNISSSGTITAGSFASRVDFLTGTSPGGVALGDLDGDGKQDVVVANNGSVSVYRNTSTTGIVDAGSFSSRTDFSTGGGANEVIIGDVDGDGKPEIVVSNQGSNSVSILQNNCTTGYLTTNSFLVKVDINSGMTPVGIALADIDGDGKLDLTIANYGSNWVSVFRNKSTPGSIDTGTFEPKVDFITQSPWGLNIGDIDGDDKMDLVVANTNMSSVSIFRNISSSGTISAGSFAPKIDFTTLNNPNHVAIADIDGDGKPDIALTNHGSAMVSTFRNTSTMGFINSGSLSARADFAVGNNPRSIIIGDIDGDNKPDIVTTNIMSHNFSVLQNKITEPVPPVIASFTPTSGQVGTTVTITGTNFSATAANNIVKFGIVQAVVIAATSTQLTVILPSGAIDSPISVIVNTLTGSSSTSFVVTPPSPPPVITSLSQTFGYVGMTLIINGTNFSTTPANNIVWFGAVKANVTVATATQLQVTVPKSATYQPVTVTVNGLTAYSRSPFIVTFPSFRIFDGSTLAPKVEIPCISGWSYFAVLYDIDLDGKPDLIVDNAGGGGKIMIYRNTGNPGSISPGSFTAGVELILSGGAYGIAVGDIDGDGKPDIAATNHNNNIVTVLRNQSTPGSITAASFGTGIDFETGSRPRGIAIGDIDGDGKPDLAVSNYGDGVNQNSYTVSVLRNTGLPGSISAASFAPKVDFQSTHGGVYVAINDMDMDGKPDLIITTFTMNISIFRNTSTPGTITQGSFAQKVDLSGSNGLNSSAIGDIDGDDKPDLVFINRENSSISVLKNVGSPGSITRNSFSARIEFPTGAKPVDVKLGDIDGDGKSDMVVAKEDSYISLFRNTCSPGTVNTVSFASKVEFNTVYGNGNLVIGDIDGDTKPDIVLKHWYENHISILRNNMPFPNLPVINSINPNSGPAGSTLTINGSDFSPVAENNTVMFGAVQGTVTSATNNQLTVTVPAGADGQPVIVMVYGYWINSGITFSVVTPSDIELESSILTLNGDGRNERFKIKYFEIYGKCSFYVYNARGAVVFWNENFMGEWDLTVKERRLETGGYFYVIKTEIGTYRGSFSILKE